MYFFLCCSESSLSNNVASEQRLGVGGGIYLGHSNFTLSMAKLSQVRGA